MRGASGLNSARFGGFAAALFLAAGCALRPGGTAVPHHLVSLEAVRPPVLAEVRYATRENFTGTQLYPSARLWLHRDAAKALSRVQADLAARGMALKIFDAYRPLSVQQRMWNLIRDERYVSNPAKNRGRHTRGTAVDVTLVDAKGAPLDMPTDFDDFTDRAHAESPHATDRQKQNRSLLATTMSRHGFLPYPFEWWHFDLEGWEKYPVLDISPQELAGGRRTAVPMP